MPTLVELINFFVNNWMTKYFWPCFYVNQPCGNSTWICSRIPLDEEKTKQWITAREEEHKENKSIWKGQFKSSIAKYNNVFEYFLANKEIPAPRIWTILPCSAKSEENK